MDDAQFSRIAKALADPQRFALLSRVAEGGGEREVPCRALVSRFDVTPATISHHLKELAAAGLVECRREGQCAFLRSRPQVLEAYLAEVRRRLLGGAKPGGR